MALNPFVRINCQAFQDSSNGIYKPISSHSHGAIYWQQKLEKKLHYNYITITCCLGNTLFAIKQEAVFLKG